MKKVLHIFAPFALIALTAATALSGQDHGGEIIYTKPLKSVTFSHKAHVEQIELSCDMCHPALFEEQALKAQEAPDFTMDSLYKGKYCGACHNGTMAFASNTRCASCHSGVKGAGGASGSKH